nr:hypothetical protein [Treponema sp.]
MSETIRVICIALLMTLAFFCFQAGFFLVSGHRIKNNSRHTLVLIEFFTGLLLFFDALAYFFRGSGGALGYYMVRISNFGVFALTYAASFFFCFYCVEFIKSGILDFKILRSPRASVKSGIPIQLFLVFYICIVGMIFLIVSQFTNLFYYFDENNLYHRSFFFPLSVALGLLPGLISLSMFLQNRRALPKNVFLSLLIYSIFPLVGVVLALFVYGITWINIAYGLGALHLFYSSLKLMELEFYSDKKESSRLNPNYKPAMEIPQMRKRISRSHLWQTVCAISSGLIAILVILSITGINIPEKTVVIDDPASSNHRANPVFVTFIRDAEKQWYDDNDITRLGAQFNGMIYNNMKSTVITDWKFSIDIPEGCSVDPNPWNGTFSFTGNELRVKKPQQSDRENIHGVDYYKVSPLKSLGFGCIMYTPRSYDPLKATLTFTYKSIFKPTSNVLFNFFMIALVIVFIVSITITFSEGKLIRIEEENIKLENTVKERTKELEEEKNRSEGLLLNILPQEIAKRLEKDKNAKIADKIENASVLFADIVGFTKITSALDAGTIVGALNSLYSRIDERAKREGIEKIKTIGDSYMAASGLFGSEGADKNALSIINFARGMLKDVEEFNASSNIKLFMRIGINSGSLIAGVIGKTKFVYDIWGDTVNVASRMESSGQGSKIHVSEQTMELTKNTVEY